MTFSLVARCAASGMFGVAISSSSPAVAARCAFVRAGVGAVASQNVTDPALGPLVLELMQSGSDAGAAIGAMQERARFPEYRQVLAIDARGGTAIHSGTRALGVWGEARGRDVAAGGNLLADARVPEAIVAAFETSAGHLGDRLLVALRAGLAAGGEAGAVRSAGLQLCDRVSWPVADLRCDWSDGCPIETLETIWRVYRPQLEDYVTRALDPRAAPAYGVPGDEG